MRRIAAILAFGTVFTATAGAQSPRRRTHRDTLTTSSGVYTFEQANRGKDVYAGNCRGCHTPETHTGPVFNAIWNGRTLAELFGFVRDRMPKNDPGALSPEEYVDVIAYMLRMNKLPIGEIELPPDSSALARIRIQIGTPTPK